MNFKEFILEKYEFDEVNIDVDNSDNIFITELIDKLSLLYKKRIDKYLRPVKIVGSFLNNDIELRINMSNKDIILFTFEQNELKVSLNGVVIYHMDNIKKENIISKIKSLYINHIENQNFKVTTKNNPFTNESIEI